MKTGINTSIREVSMKESPKQSVQHTPSKKLEFMTDFHNELVTRENDILELKQRMLLHESEDLNVPPGDSTFTKKL